MYVNKAYEPNIWQMHCYNVFMDIHSCKQIALWEIITSTKGPSRWCSNGAENAIFGEFSTLQVENTFALFDEPVEYQHDIYG